MRLKKKKMAIALKEQARKEGRRTGFAALLFGKTIKQKPSHAEVIATKKHNVIMAEAVKRAEQAEKKAALTAPPPMLGQPAIDDENLLAVTKPTKPNTPLHKGEY